MSLVSAMENIIEKATLNAEENQGGYIGTDGLLYCTVCNERKQCRIKHPFTSEERIVSCLCKCGREAYDREKREIKKCTVEGEYYAARSHGLDDFRLFRWFNNNDYEISPTLIEERQNLLKRLCFPAAEKMYNCNFENDDGANEQLTKIAREYVANFDEMRKKGIGLLLFGETGRGKSFITACIANELIDKGIPVHMTNFERLSNILQGMWNGKQTYIDNLNNFPLLIIDDLAAERDTEYMNGVVHNIIDSRVRSGLPMIITTNLTREELLGANGLNKVRVYHRLFERCLPHEVIGNDRRLDTLQKNRKAYNQKLGIK